MTTCESLHLFEEYKYHLHKQIPEGTVAGSVNLFLNLIAKPQMHPLEFPQKMLFWKHIRGSAGLTASLVAQRCSVYLETQEEKPLSSGAAPERPNLLQLFFNQDHPFGRFWVCQGYSIMWWFHVWDWDSNETGFKFQLSHFIALNLGTFRTALSLWRICLIKIYSILLSN